MIRISRKIEIQSGTYEFEVSGLLDLFQETTLDVVAEASGISNGESEWTLDGNGEFLAVDFSHALDFSDAHNVAVFKIVTVRLDDGDDTFLVLSDAFNVSGLRVLSVAVVNSEAQVSALGLVGGVFNFRTDTEVVENEAEDTESITGNVENFVSVANFVDAQHFSGGLVVGHANNLELLEEVLGQFAVVNGQFDTLVEFGKSLQRGFGSVLSDIFFRQEEL